VLIGNDKMARIPAIVNIRSQLYTMMKVYILDKSNNVTRIDIFLKFNHRIYCKISN